MLGEVENYKPLQLLKRCNCLTWRRWFMVEEEFVKAANIT